MVMNEPSAAIPAGVTLRPHCSLLQYKELQRGYGNQTQLSDLRQESGQNSTPSAKREKAWLVSTLCQNPHVIELKREEKGGSGSRILHPH
jgi:hypothetical protein